MKGFIPNEMDSPASLGYRKEELIKNFKKRLTRLGFEPPTSSFEGGSSNHLAIDMSCER